MASSIAPNTSPPYDRSQPPIQWLPLELLLEILGYLSDSHTVILALTCKRFFSVLWDQVQSRKCKRDILGMIQKDLPGYMLCSDLCSILHLPLQPAAASCEGTRGDHEKPQDWLRSKRCPILEQMGDFCGLGKIYAYEICQAIPRLRPWERRPTLLSLVKSTDWTKLDNPINTEIRHQSPVASSDAQMNNPVTSWRSHGYAKLDTESVTWHGPLLLRCIRRVWFRVNFHDEEWAEVVASTLLHGLSIPTRCLRLFLEGVKLSKKPPFIQDQLQRSGTGARAFDHGIYGGFEAAWFTHVHLDSFESFRYPGHTNLQSATVHPSGYNVIAEWLRLRLP